MISELKHTLLLHQELSMAGNRIAGQVTDAELGLSYVDGLVVLVKVDVQDFEMAVAKSSGLEMTPEVQAADDRRDRRYRALKAHITLKGFSEDAAIGGQASYLWEIVKKHNPSLWALGMTEESAKLKAFFDELEKDEKAQAAIAVIGLGEELNALKTAQDNFEKVYVLRAKEASFKDDLKVNECRKRLTDDLQALLITLDVADMITKEEAVRKKIVDLIGEINPVISSTMAIARARISREENDDKEPEKPAA